MCSVLPKTLSLDNHSGGLGLDLIDVTNHVKGTLGELIMLTVDDLLETLDGVLETDELTGGTGEDLSDVEGLRHELLDLTRSGDDELIILRKLVHTQNRNYILK